MPGTYIFVINVRYAIAPERGVLVALSQNNWNLDSWSFSINKNGDNDAYGKISKTFVTVRKITSNLNFKVEIGINWAGDGENNVAQAQLQAIRIA